MVYFEMYVMFVGEKNALKWDLQLSSMAAVLVVHNIVLTVYY